MAEIVNLRRARKAKARAGEAAKAQENRVLHGRTKEERRRIAAERDAAARQIDGHRLPSGQSDPLSAGEPEPD